MWGSGRGLIWTSCLLYSPCLSSPHRPSKIHHFYSSPTPSPPATSFLVSTNPWKGPIHVPFFFFILKKSILLIVTYQWHQGSWRICRHLVNIPKGSDLTARGQGHFTQGQVGAWGMHDIGLCTLLTLSMRPAHRFSAGSPEQAKLLGLWTHKFPTTFHL